MVRVRHWSAAAVVCGLTLTLTACNTGSNPLGESAGADAQTHVDSTHESEEKP